MQTGAEQRHTAEAIERNRTNTQKRKTADRHAHRHIYTQRQKHKDSRKMRTNIVAQPFLYDLLTEPYFFISRVHLRGKHALYILTAPLPSQKQLPKMPVSQPPERTAQCPGGKQQLRHLTDTY